MFDTIFFFQLAQVQIKDHLDDKYIFELIDKVGRQSLILKLYREVKQFWLQYIKVSTDEYGKIFFTLV